MEYKIVGAPLPVVTCTLDRGESMFTESGGMSWRDQEFSMETSSGGMKKMFGRAVSGESLFTVDYTATAPGAQIAFASSFPGDIIAFDLHECGSIIVQKSGFLAAEKTVKLEAHMSGSIGRGLFGGEGFVLQRLSGTGVAFIEIDGSVFKKELAPGQKIQIDTGYMAAMTETCTFEIVSVKGLKNKFFGGEGLFNNVITGPGTVWLQSMPVEHMAGSLAPFIAISND